ncbi:hypothetical protein Pmar_PMAR018550 [Perkinsus marinus ATCC 50983]|uniref:Uncharacterized protein n=1 Tax=Perkinsus marinus (strain ATCC 50983 / TXsc) TaxID=423536 RepID=C5L048_PERM5|nr:hypothetical protein Pmar_PMAR018550 [Perkinsus marinus ATCC 50983]EER09906.1 hypothetical protein Pmar_PMAR018550 [Perkinsus marinus ATCC 50983]|eukprot:XP_002778111.1 hypothetical protein Pmar_PMAR018550 [Perkinsus marinus ATCC 50983]
MASSSPKSIINDKSVIYPTIKNGDGLDGYRYLVWGSQVGTEDHNKLIHGKPYLPVVDHPSISPEVIIKFKSLATEGSYHWCPLIDEHISVIKPFYPNRVVDIDDSIYTEFEKEISALNISKPGSVSPYIWASLSPVLRWYILHGETHTILSKDEPINMDLLEELNLINIPRILNLGIFARYISVVAMGIASDNYLFDGDHHIAVGLTPMVGFDLQSSRSTTAGCIAIPRDIYEGTIKINYISKMILYNCIISDTNLQEEVDVRSILGKSGPISRDLILKNVGHIGHLIVSSNDLITIDRLIKGMQAYQRVEDIVGYNIAALEADSDLEE